MPNQMDTDSYKFLLNKTQEALRCIISTRELVSTFDVLLQDCILCVSQSLYLVPVTLSEAEVCIDALIEYINNAVNMLVLLSKSIKAVSGTTLTTCCEMKTFPTSIARIIAEVYTHCKDSEALYGNYFSHVIKEIKSLHISCHKLQLSYGMVLEKHFVFNVNDMEEREILLEALKVNLSICETVQTIDLNTVAVQWKFIMMVYDKYSAMLSNTSVFQDCMALLCQLIRDSVKIALEANENSTSSQRSLMVANFQLKALLRACCIFENATNKEYDDLVRLLFYIHEIRTRDYYLQMPAEKKHCIDVIVSSTKLLLKLLEDETFAKALFECDTEKVSQEGSVVGFILILTFVMDNITQENNINEVVTKAKLITCLYDILPKCNSWDLHTTVWSERNLQSHSLIKHLLKHTLALVTTLNRKEFCLLEKYMAEAVLSTDHISALFSSNLWTSLAMARYLDTNPQLLFNQVIWLCTMYKKLEKHCMFKISPQKVHLTHTLTRLFAAMEDDDKIRICKQFRIHDDDNLALWAALAVKSLPQEAKDAAEAVVAQKLKLEFECFKSITPEKIDQLNRVMTVAATCTFAQGGKITDYIMRAWSKTCPNQGYTITRVEAGATWYYEYLRALIALTESMWHHLCVRNVNLIEVLHYVTGIIQQCDTEFKLLFINILCKLATSDCVTKLNDLTVAFTCLYQSGDIVRSKLFNILKQHTHNNIDKVLKADQTLFESWTRIKNNPDCIDVKIDTNVKFKYIHKCLGSKDMKIENSNVSGKKSSGYFDFADNLEKLFENDKGFEEPAPAPKKPKLECEAAEIIVKRLETDTALLRTMKENVSVQYKSRIQSVCDELNYIIN